MKLTRLRSPSPEVLKQLEEYDFEAFGPTGLRTYDLAVMSEAGMVLLAHIDGEIVGSCQLMRVLDEPDFFYVVGFYIRPRWRGQRLSLELLRQAAEESRALGAKGLLLTTAPTNTVALSLYQGAGFVIERFVPHFYGDKEDRYILRWRFLPEGGLAGLGMIDVRPKEVGGQ